MLVRPAYILKVACATLQLPWVWRFILLTSPQTAVRFASSAGILRVRRSSEDFAMDTSTFFHSGFRRRLPFLASFTLTAVSVWPTVLFVWAEEDIFSSFSTLCGLQRCNWRYSSLYIAVYTDSVLSLCSTSLPDWRTRTCLTGIAIFAGRRYSKRPC